MRAIELQGNRLTLRTDFPEPVAGPGEQVLDVLMAGVCETDRQLVRGYINFAGVIGHEFVAQGREGEWAGRRVVVDINCACRACPMCERGLHRHCPHRTVIGIVGRQGAFAERIAVPTCNLHAVPDEIPTPEAVFVEPLAAALAIREQVDVRPHDRIVVLGDGRLGTLCALALQRESPQVTVVGKHADKLARIASRGLRTVLLSEFDPHAEADVVVDATGSPSGLDWALRTVRPRGTVVLKTTIAGPHTLSLAPVVIHEIRLVGSRCGLFPEALDVLRSRSLDVSWMIDEVVSLDEVPAVVTREHSSLFKSLVNVS